MNALSRSNVYFVKPTGAAGPIKIGCAGDVAKRLDQLTRSSPVELEMICSAPGSLAIEQKLHIKHSASRLRFEWFLPSAALLADIQSVRAGVTIAALVHDVQAPKPRVADENERLYRSYTARMSAAQIKLKSSGDLRRWRKPERAVIIMERWRAAGYTLPTPTDLEYLDTVLRDPHALFGRPDDGVVSA